MIFLVVDLVEGHPVFHFVFIATHHGVGIMNKEINHFTVSPATVFFHQMIWHFKMRQRDYGFDTIFQQFIEQIIIELQTSFIRFGFVTIRENTRPGNRSTEAFKTHFGE